MIFGTYGDPHWLRRWGVIIGGIVLLLAGAVALVGFMPGFASIVLFFGAVSTAATVLLWKLFD